jgi:hypothetical protein
MNNDLPTTETDASALEVISTFIDGERVEPEDLKRALALSEGRDYLIDLLTIREAMGGLGSFAVPGRGLAPIWKLVRGTAAAAVVLLALAGGYFAGHRANGSDRTPPPSPGSQVLVVTSVPEAPTPTQVIKLEPGVNWSDTNGGK